MTNVDWTPYIPPFDPRRLEGTTLQEDRHGRLVETADCGTRCPGCGLCCNGLIRLDASIFHPASRRL